MRAVRLTVLGLLLIAVPACLLIAGGWWWLNSYVHTDQFRRALEIPLSQSLQGPVQIGQVSFNFFNGVEMRDVSYHANISTLQEKADIRVSQIDCSYSWRKLMQGKLSLTKLTLHQPEMSISSLLSPLPPSNSTANLPPVETSPALTSSEPNTSTLPVYFSLNEIDLTEGNVSFQNDEGRTSYSLKDINLQADTRELNLELLKGKMTVQELNFPSGGKITNLSTAFVYQRGALDVLPFTGNVFGGNMAGDYTLSPPLPSTLNLNIKGSDISQVTETFAPQLQITGTLDLQSKWRALETTHLAGEGDWQLENGQLSNVMILQEISDALKIKELAAPTFTEAGSHFTIDDQQLRLASLDIEGDIYSLTGDGTLNLTFEKALALNLVLTLRKEAMDKIPNLITSSFIKKEDGSGSISFQIGGTMNQPTTNLPNRLLSQNTELKNVISDVLENFFHKHEKKSPQNNTTPALSAPLFTVPPPGLAVPAVTNASPANVPLSTPATNNVSGSGL